MDYHTDHLMLENYNVHYIKVKKKNRDDASYIRIKTQIRDSKGHEFATVKNCIKNHSLLRDIEDILTILSVIMLMPMTGYYRLKYYSDLSPY